MLAFPTSVPLIDLEAASPDALRRAAQECGLFFVVNHGVPATLLDAHFAVARSFFALGDAEKRAIGVTSERFRGYEPFRSQTIDPAAPGDRKEGFIMGPDLPSDHPHVLAGFPNTGSNRWPITPAGLREQFEGYVEAMNHLGRRLARRLARSLDLPASYFAAALRAPLTYSQLFHYPPTEHERGLGAGAHVDWGMLTLLLQDDVGGLEVQTRDGAWHEVAPLPGALVVILGEMMIRLTDGFFRSAPHRVTSNRTGRSRYSMPTFFDPGYDERIACVPTCRPLSGEPRFPACTVAEHMREMARETLTEQMRLTPRAR